MKVMLGGAVHQGVQRIDRIVEVEAERLLADIGRAIGMSICAKRLLPFRTGFVQFIPAVSGSGAPNGWTRDTCNSGSATIRLAGSREQGSRCTGSGALTRDLE